MRLMSLHSDERNVPIGLAYSTSGTLILKFSLSQTYQIFPTLEELMDFVIDYKFEI